MSIRFRIGPSFLADAKSPVTLEVTGGTVGECLDQIVSREPVVKKTAFDETGNLKTTTQVYINNIPVLVHPLERAVKDSDEIGLIYAAQESC